MSAEKPLVYLILGAAGAGRREVVADLIEGGGFAPEKTAVIISENEIGDEQPTGLNPITWHADEDNNIEATWPAEATVGFFITDGRSNPVDQIEAFKPWLEEQGLELARVICVVHCRLLARHSALNVWYDACVHFSDYVLLHQRDGVDNKWLSDYRTHFAKRYIPSLIDMVKKGRVKNPALVLDQQTRRLSHFFDEDETDGWKAFVADAEDVIIGDEAEDDLDDEVNADEDEYLARYPSGGRRRVIPKISEYLNK